MKKAHCPGPQESTFWPLYGPTWDRALEGRGAQECWLVFEAHLLQAQEQCIQTRRKLGKNVRRPTWMNKELMSKLRTKTKKISEGRNEDRWPGRHTVKL